MERALPPIVGDRRALPARSGRASAAACASRSERRTAWLAALVAMFTIAGYPIVAGLTTVMSVDNRPASIAARALFLLMTLIVLVRARWTRPGAATAVFWAAWWLFWVLYLVRLLFDGAVQPDALKIPLMEYLTFALGASLLPAVAMSGRHVPYMMQRLFWPLLLICTFGLLINLWAIFFQQGLLAQLQFAELRAESETLNPISIGHLGATAVLMSFWHLFGPTDGTSPRRRLLPATAIALGLIAIAASGSRGPALALALCLLAAFAVLGTGMLRAAVATLLAGLAIGVFVGERGLGLDAESLFLIERLSESAFSDSERERLLAAGWQAFLAWPLTGAGTEPLETYPHNLVLESFVALGIVGGGAFCTLLAIALARAFKLAHVRPHHFWVSLLLLQYTVGAMFSGNLSQSSVLWVLLALVVSVANPTSPARSADRMIRRSSEAHVP